MTNRPTFTDEQLTAYLDRELDHIPADEIRAALEHDAALKARIEQLSLDTGQIADAFDDLLAKAPEMPDLAVDVQTEDSWWRRKVTGLAAAAVIAALAIGWGVGDITGKRDLETWDQYVAAYHALYVNSTLSGIDQSEQSAVAELELVSQSVGRPVDYSQITDIASLDYKRAQILGFEGRPLMQLTFLSKVGAPIALCIIRSDGSANSSVRKRQMQGMSSAQWAKDGYEFLLIGGTDEPLISSVAERLSKSL